jgi:hypothetical protein
MTRWRLYRSRAYRVACAFVAGMVTRGILTNHDRTWIVMVVFLLFISLVAEDR